MSNNTLIVIFNFIDNTFQKAFGFTLKSKVIQYIYMFTICFISLIYLLRFYFLSRKGQSKLSTQLRIHVFAYMMFTICVIVYVAPIIYYWNNSVGEQFSLIGFALTGSSNVAGGCLTILSTLFITLDRIYTLCFPLRSRDRCKYRVQMFSILVLATVFIVNTNIGFWRSLSINNYAKTTSCLNYGCINQGLIKDIVAFKMCIGWSNIIAGSIFIFIYFRFGRKMIIRREKKKNYVVLLILINEFCFTIVPTTIFVFFNVNGNTSYTYINPTSFMSPSQCLDAGITTIVFWRTWREKLKKPKNGPQAVIPLPKDFPSPTVISHPSRAM